MHISSLCTCLFSLSQQANRALTRQSNSNCWRFWGGNLWSHVNCCHNSVCSTVASICFCTTAHNQEVFLSVAPKGKLWQTRGKTDQKCPNLVGTETLWRQDSTSTPAGKRQWQTKCPRPPEKNTQKKRVDEDESFLHHFRVCKRVRWLERVRTCNVHELGHGCEVWRDLRSWYQLAKI